MKMTFPERIEAAYDFWRPNRAELRPYLLDDGKTHPVAVICPGGGYRMVCSFVEGLPFAKALNALGYHAFVVYYRVGRKALYPAPQRDLARAIRTLHEHAEDWHLDLAGYSLWGSSAGAHLTASFCAKNRSLPQPGALILTYPVVTMGDLTHEGSRRNLLGANPTPAQVRALSVEQQVTPGYPPTYLWCGEDDHTVDPENSRMLADALKAAGVPYRFDTYPGIDHGVGLGRAEGIDWFENAVEFWEEQRSKGKR